VDDHEDLLFTDLALFNRKLADWLVFYNASASAPHPRPALPAILPPATSTRVPKVLDSYNHWTSAKKHVMMVLMRMRNRCLVRKLP
jgi:hypothetical protein